MFHVHYFFHFVTPAVRTNKAGFEEIISKLNFAYKIENFDDSIFIYSKRNLKKLSAKLKICLENTNENVFTIIPQKKYRYQYQVQSINI